MSKVKSLVRSLMRPGPYRVVCGNFSYSGIHARIWAPHQGKSQPGIVFGHDWLTGLGQYDDLLTHLASWGMILVAPQTHQGIAPSAIRFSDDLNRSLDIILHSHLGTNHLVVDPHRLGIIGHGFGASAAVLAAHTRPISPAGVVAIFPKPTTPSPESIASSLDCPGLILAEPHAPTSLLSNAYPLAQQWNQATMRLCQNAIPDGLGRHRWWAKFLGLTRSDRRTYRQVQALLTGYLLGQVCGEKKYRIFTDPHSTLPYSHIITDYSSPVSVEEKIQLLLH